MAERKSTRVSKRQLGQYMTPQPLAKQIVASLKLSEHSRVLEPSFGTGSFLLEIIEKLMEYGEESIRDRYHRIMRDQVFGVEIDSTLYNQTISKVEMRWGPLPSDHNLVLGDYFKTEYFIGMFDYIIGNPPFGGTFDPLIEDQLDRWYGRWNGKKLKKETYSFFIARSLDFLAMGGVLVFISSDTFTTISTMQGLRRRLLDEAVVSINRLESFSDETSQPVVVLHATKGGPSDQVHIDGEEINRSQIELTGNFSWGLTGDMARFFSGPTLANYMVGTSGMTIGKNEYFVREIKDGSIVEPYFFDFFNDPITLEGERQRARLGQLSDRQVQKINTQEAVGETRRNVRVVLRPDPEVISLPHPDYKPYNKANTAIIFSQPKYVVYWKNNGDAVLTFKRNGNWYLHGVGGQPFFGREGLSWQLIAPRLRMRYLPSGYILDSGAPCGFLKPGVDQDELWFILGWAQTELATRILKGVINHTRNIQSKDLERLPYPWWVGRDEKKKIISLVRDMVDAGKKGRNFGTSDQEIRMLDQLFIAPPEIGCNITY